MEEEVEVGLSGMDRSGAAVGRIGDESLLVPGGIPGERVRVRRRAPEPALPAAGRPPRDRAAIADIVAVLDASPERVRPRCRHAAICGGCSWQHIAYPEQLRQKARVLQAMIARGLGRADVRLEASGCIGSPVGDDGMPWGFRQKSAFVFAPAQDGSLVMGHFVRGSHAVVPVVECPVHPERANRIAFALRDELRRAGIAAAGSELGGLVRHVLVRSTRDESEAVAALVVTREDAALERPLSALLRQPLRPEGLVLNIHDRPGPFLLGRQTLRVAGTGHVKETSLGPAFLVSPTAFFQTNVAAAASLLELVTAGCEGTFPRAGRQRAGSPLAILDLYSGSGLFALPLALRGHTVTAVEESRKGVRDAELNRKTNGVGEQQLRLVSSSVERALPRFAAGAFDAVVLDPPREGTPLEVLQEVFGRLRCARAVLVSCSPEALAREVSAAARAGYRVAAAQAVDMFPHTAHIEAVVVLERQGSPAERRPRRRSLTRPGEAETERRPRRRRRS